MHKSVARAERNAVASSCCKRHIFWLVFWQIPCRHQTTAALCIRAGAKRNEAKRSQRNQINLFKNSDQIRICRRFIVYYCYYDSVASIREIDFDGFFVYSSLSPSVSLLPVPFIRNAIFIRRRSNGHESWCILCPCACRFCVSLCFFFPRSWIILLWIYWCVAFFGVFGVRAIRSHRTRLILLTYLFLWLVLNSIERSECVPIPIPIHNVRASAWAWARSKAFGRPFRVCVFIVVMWIGNFDAS